MDSIEYNEMHLMSHIIYTIYNTENTDKMRHEVLKLLKYLIPFDTGNFWLIKVDDNDKYVPSDLINVNSLKNTDNLYPLLERYMKESSDIDSTYWNAKSNNSLIYRTTDFISEETFEKSDYYREMFLPYDLYYGVQMFLAYNDACVALLALFRSKEKGNFSEKEIFFLDNIKEHLSVRLGNEKKKKDAFVAKHRTSEFIEKYGLTRRECEILDLLYDGWENERISSTLYISENTLRRHIYNIYSKLGIKARWELFFL